MSNLPGKVAIILAGGDATRYGFKTKALLSIGNETILERQVRQARRYCENIFVVTKQGEIIKKCDELRIPIIFGFENASTQRAIFNTSDKWVDRTHILWGDVIFSKDAVDKVFTVPGLRFFGSVKQREGFAWSFDIEYVPRVLDSLAVTDFNEWQFYRYLCGCPLEEEKYEDKIFYDIDDWTTDIDNPAQYVIFLTDVVNGGKLDDTV